MPFDMLKLISSYPISRRLIIAFALAAILPSMMIAIMGTYYVNQLSTRRDASSVIASAQDNTNHLSDTLHHMYSQTKVLENQVLSELLSSDAASRKSMNSSVSQTITETTQDSYQFTQSLTTYQAQYNATQSPNMQSVMNILNMVAQNDDTPTKDSNLLGDITATSWPNYRAAQSAELTQLQQVVSTLASGNHLDIPNTVSRLNKDSSSLNSTYSDVVGDWNELGGYISSISKHVDGVDTNETQPIIMGTIGAFLLTLLIVTIAGILVHRSISGPLNELVLLTKRISKGDRLARAHVTSSDEISIVATAMNTMLDNIVHLVQDTQAQRDVLQGQVEKLVSEVSGVGDGDLRVNAEVTADALGVLADSFNYMIEELGSLVVRVKKVAREVEESTTITTERMGQLVDTSDRQIDEIAEAAMEIERMAINSQQVVGRALALANSARDARISAQGGRQAVQQTIEGMGRIYTNVQETSNKVQTLGERSREINNIVEAISNIAHQTNRLALDAAIQAAMAGDNGKGFGAVAADIRRLAERAKELSTDVGRIVRSVRDDIGAVAIAMNDTERETSSGSKLAAEAGTSLESIVAVIEHQAIEIEGINQMAVQQQQSSTEVVQMMQSVSETTQRSTTSTRDAAQNMERVARLAEQLLASVEAFKLRDNLNYLGPNGDTFSENLDSPRISGELFRTVTSTVQQISNDGGYSEQPVPGADGYLPQFPQFAASPFPQGNANGNGYLPNTPSSELYGMQAPFPPTNNGRSTQPPRGNNGQQTPFPPTNNGRSTQPPRGNNGQQTPFPPTNNGRSTQPPQGNYGGEMPFPPPGNAQQPFQAWNNGDNQQAFPPLNNWTPGTQPRPVSEDWQAENRNQSDWRA
jgi:methyl-accepting chemotaxis protein